MFGGKGGAGVYQRLINQIPPHFVYVAAFLGNDAIMRHKRPALLNIGIDKNESAVEDFSMNCWADDCTQNLIVGCGVDFLETHFRAGDKGTLTKPNDGDFHYGGFCVPGERVFVYLDPPYRMKNRKSGERYLFECDDVFHLRILRLATSLSCRVMISSYPNEMYDDALKGWRTFTFEAMTRGGMATEQVWCNYPEPVELHDYRFLGGERREREKIRKRAKNLTASMASMPAVERNALFAEVCDLMLNSDKSMNEDGTELYRIFDKAGAVGFSRYATFDSVALERDWPGCRVCGADFAIGESGLVCPDGCGTVKPIARYFSPSEFRSVSELRAAFPEKCLG